MCQALSLNLRVSKIEKWCAFIEFMIYREGWTSNELTRMLCKYYRLESLWTPEEMPEPARGN